MGRDVAIIGVGNVAMAYDAIGAGATYPTLYNDDVEVPAVEYGMRVPREIAEQYVPFGCTEFVIQGKSVGTPNTLINLLKILQMSLNGGIDPYDGVDKSAGVHVRPIEELVSFDDLSDNYKRLLDRYMPGLLPFIVTGVIWYLHDRKNASVTKLLLGLIVVGIVGAIIGLF